MQWKASERQLTYYDQGYLSEPVLWWADIFTLDAAFGYVEEQLEDKAGGPRLPKPKNFEDVARGE